MKIKLICLFAAVALGACSPTPGEGSADQSMVELVDGYLAHRIEMDPFGAPYLGRYELNGQFGNPLTDAYQQQLHTYNEQALVQAKAIHPAQLSPERKLTQAIFIRDLEMEIAAEQFPEEQLPVNQFDSRFAEFVQMGSGEGAFPFAQERDFSDFISRMKGFAPWMDSVIAQMRMGMASGVVLPKVLVERMQAQVEAQLVDDLRESVFYAPVLAHPELMSGATKLEYEQVLRESVLASFAKFSVFLQREYLAAARPTAGYGQLPNGDNWYQHLADLHTTTSKAVDEIHQLGLSEVTRIHAEMDKVRQQVGFEGDLAAFFQFLATDEQFFFESEQALIDAYQVVKKRIDTVLPQFFEIAPKADYEVRPVEAFRQRSAAGASYMAPAPDGSRPGIFYINTYNLRAQPKWGVTTLSLHEASPGHHFQIAIQQELEGLPDYQKFGGSNAFAEGWALYAEHLGIEMGLFEDPYQYFGKLSDELLRAMRLVVDTGLHRKGWSREQAIEYMRSNSAMAQTDIEAEVERYMAIPGQALSYKIGQIKILELRKMAEQRLGDRFDLKAFHTQVLSSGNLPMAVLEQKIEHWVAQQPASA